MTESSTAATIQAEAPTFAVIQGEASIDRAARLRAYISEQLALLGTYRDRTIETRDPESIHKLRVTTRRLQIAVDFIVRDGHVQTKPFKKQLRRLRRRLSPIRNYDVFVAALRAESDSSQKRHKPSLASMESSFAERREKCFSRARKLLENDRMPGVESANLSTLCPVPVDGMLMNQRAIEVIGRRLEQFRTLAASIPDTSDRRQIHRLRIATKRLRYSLEVLGRTGYGEFDKPLMWLRALQDRLGEWHDFAALGEEIVRTASRRKFMASHLLECAALVDLALRLEAKRRRLEPRIVPVRVPRLIASARRQVEKSCAGNRRSTKRV